MIQGALWAPPLIVDAATYRSCMRSLREYRGAVSRDQSQQREIGDLVHVKHDTRRCDLCDGVH